MRPLTPTILALTLALAGGLAACGGNHETETASTEREPPTTTLLDDDGNPMPTVAAAVPADAGARTRQGRYATARQAAWLERSLGSAVLNVDVECCGAEGVEQAVGIAHGLQAAQDLPDRAPVLVRGADLRLAAVAADRMAAAGHTQVWLVTP
jgi:hypothetical protein